MGRCSVKIMTEPWALYDDLIGEISPEVTVTHGSAGLRWCQVTTSDGGHGMAYTIPEQSRPTSHAHPTFQGARLRDVAELAKSWNFAEAGIGMAAINAWYAHKDRVAANGVLRATTSSWQELFEPYAHDVEGKVVAVVGHFPFAPASRGRAADLRVLERHTQPGDYPDTACEYLLADCDYVFISGSAFVNKTMPRLLTLASHATTVVVGPSTPLSPTLGAYGVDAICGYVATDPVALTDSLGGLTLAGMASFGHRVDWHRSDGVGSG